MKVVFYISFCDLIKCKKLIAISYSHKYLSIAFIKNGYCHNSNNYAFYHYKNNNKETKDFYYKDHHFCSVKNISGWKKIVKELKREEKLGIFK